MYTKFIGDRQVFSDCRTIQMNDGSWISNPTQEQIANAGWTKYIPPEILSRIETEPNNEELIAAVKKMLSPSIESLSDEEALEVAALYPTWISKVNQEVKIGERYWYNEKLYKVIQTHTVQNDWTPDITKSLWVEVSIEEYPEWIQPIGSQDAYNAGDKVKHNNKHWESTVDANVWEPGTNGTESLWKEV